MFGIQNQITDARAAYQRKMEDHARRLYARSIGAEERKAKAQAKRDRKNAKRALDDAAFTIGQFRALASV